MVTRFALGFRSQKWEINLFDWFFRYPSYKA
jgi:hypothetical protein